MPSSDKFDNSKNPCNSVGFKYNFRLHHVMLRINDPNESLEFYNRNFGLKCVHSYEFKAMKFSLYYLTKSTISGDSYDSQNYLWNSEDFFLELTYNHSDLEKEQQKVDHSKKIFSKNNVEIQDGFRYLGFSTNDLKFADSLLKERGVRSFEPLDDNFFQGNDSRNAKFFLDPNGYPLKIISREIPDHSSINNKFNLFCITLMIQNVCKSLNFYCNIFSMTVIHSEHHHYGSTYYLSSLKSQEYENFKSIASDTEKENFMYTLSNPLLQLTHHLTHENKEHCYNNGNTTEEKKSYGHINFLCDNIEEAINDLERNHNISIKKYPSQGKMKDVAFVYDPDNYWVELVQRGNKIPSDLE